MWSGASALHYDLRNQLGFSPEVLGFSEDGELTLESGGYVWWTCVSLFPPSQKLRELCVRSQPGLHRLLVTL